MMTKILLDQTTNRPRSGWRVVVFLLLLISPWFIAQLLVTGTKAGGSAAANEAGLSMILNYLMMTAWVFLVSWICLVWLDSEPLGSLGLGFSNETGNIFRNQFFGGLSGGTAMVLIIVLVQIIGGGSRLAFNPFWQIGGMIDHKALRHSIEETLLTVGMMAVAALFEELLYRGYAFQTLLRGAHPSIPIVALSLLFGLGHWGNPNRTLFSTANTVLAGIWLSVAYLRSRNLWYPTALHLSWNLMLGPIFGLPVSGRIMPAHPLLLTSSGSPVWLTGGSYGSEGGVAATVVLLGAIIITSLRTDKKSATPGPEARP
ncbi:MAG: CPBP family intramembrane glutamic endopeptidase [Blastocatellia bacterium]